MTTELKYAYPTSDNAKQFGFYDTGCYHFTYADNNYAAAGHTEIHFLAAMNGIELIDSFASRAA